MDSFYRVVRKRTKILMDSAGKPEGGKLSFDAENRKAWKGDPPAPEVPLFKVDKVTEELIATRKTLDFATHELSWLRRELKRAVTDGAAAVEAERKSAWQQASAARRKLAHVSCADLTTAAGLQP